MKNAYEPNFPFLQRISIETWWFSFYMQDIRVSESHLGQILCPLPSSWFILLLFDESLFETPNASLDANTKQMYKFWHNNKNDIKTAGKQ